MSAAIKRTRPAALRRLIRKLAEEARILHAASVLMDGRTTGAKNYSRLAALLNEAAQELRSYN